MLGRREGGEGGIEVLTFERGGARTARPAPRRREIHIQINPLRQIRPTRTTSTNKRIHQRRTRLCIKTRIPRHGTNIPRRLAATIPTKRHSRHPYPATTSVLPARGIRRRPHRPTDERRGAEIIAYVRACDDERWQSAEELRGEGGEAVRHGGRGVAVYVGQARLGGVGARGGGVWGTRGEFAA